MATRALDAASPALTDERATLLADLERSLASERAARERLRAKMAEIEAEGERQRRSLAA